MYRAERVKQELHGVRRSKLLVTNNDEIVLSQPIKELCTTVDAVIYVVNSTNINRGMIWS